jgi:hypothetical protein
MRRLQPSKVASRFHCHVSILLSGSVSLLSLHELQPHGVRLYCVEILTAKVSSARVPKKRLLGYISSFLAEYAEWYWRTLFGS